MNEKMLRGIAHLRWLQLQNSLNMEQIELLQDLTDVERAENKRIRDDLAAIRAKLEEQ